MTGNLSDGTLKLSIYLYLCDFFVEPVVVVCVLVVMLLMMEKQKEESSLIQWILSRTSGHMRDVFVIICNDIMYHF